jgi:hypothetical protein
MLVFEGKLTVRWVAEGPPRPGRPSLGHKKEISVDKFEITFALPPPAAADVVNRELTISITGVDSPIVQNLNGAARESDRVQFDEDAELSVTLVDIDNAGNRSPASAAFVYRVVDDVAPPAPGAVGISSKTEVPPGNP